MDSAKEYEKGQIIHGYLQLLTKIHKMVFKDCKSNHFFAKEGSEVRMEFQV
jgi:hypothetical protein